MCHPSYVRVVHYYCFSRCVLGGQFILGHKQQSKKAHMPRATYDGPHWQIRNNHQRWTFKLVAVCPFNSQLPQTSRQDGLSLSEPTFPEGVKAIHSAGRRGYALDIPSSDSKSLSNVVSPHSFCASFRRLVSLRVLMLFVCLSWMRK